tara:strand:- start:210 stop:713 length:504 start_codon:yes stop_codon:yes gene_type:complete
MYHESATPCVGAIDKRLFASLAAARSVTPEPAVVEVKLTEAPFTLSVVQPEMVPEVVSLSDAFALPPAAKLAKLAATSAAVADPEAVTVIPANVKLCPDVIAEKVTRACSVTAALLLINVADTPMFEVLMAFTTPVGVVSVTLTVVFTPGEGPWLTTTLKPVPLFNV